MNLATLVLIMTFNGYEFEPAIIRTLAMPAAQCEAMARVPPKKKGWSTVAFCTPGGDMRRNAP
jgi:hypothetical protein